MSAGEGGLEMGEDLRGRLALGVRRRSGRRLRRRAAPTQRRADLALSAVEPCPDALPSPIAQRAVEHNLPVFVVTQYYHRVDPGKNEFGIPPQAIVKSKSTLPGWMAGEIRDELRRRGVYFHPKKVFLIYGHDRLSDEATEQVEKFGHGPCHEN